MAGGTVPHFQNDAGHRAIDIGVKEFMCVGANPPFDHPHVYLDMGSDDEKVCPYCSTLYRYAPGAEGNRNTSRRLPLHRRSRLTLRPSWSSRAPARSSLPGAALPG